MRVRHSRHRHHARAVKYLVKIFFRYFIRSNLCDNIVLNDNLFFPCASPLLCPSNTAAFLISFFCVFPCLILCGTVQPYAHCPSYENLSRTTSANSLSPPPRLGGYLRIHLVFLLPKTPPSPYGRHFSFFFFTHRFSSSPFFCSWDIVAGQSRSSYGA